MVAEHMNFRQFVEGYTLDDAYGTLRDFKAKFGLAYIPEYEQFKDMIEKAPVVLMPMSMLSKIENTTASPNMVGKKLGDNLEKMGLAGKEDPRRQYSANQSVQHHSDMALQGKTEPIIVLRAGKRLILLDGDHRLYAYAAMGKPVPAKIITL